jgi:hypothetical protein
MGARKDGNVAGGFEVWLAKRWLKMTGWSSESAPPPVPKAVVVSYPHTTNWDLAYALAVSRVHGIRVRWIGKHTLFRFPIGGLMRWLGGVPVDRSRNNNLVAAAAEMLRQSDNLYLLIPPEGTRSKSTHWRTGFYHIAREAGVPILLGYLDYPNKKGGFGEVFSPSGDLRADMEHFRQYYSDKHGLYLEKEGPIALKDELAGPAATETKR